MLKGSRKRIRTVRYDAVFYPKHKKYRMTGFTKDQNGKIIYFDKEV